MLSGLGLLGMIEHSKRLRRRAAIECFGIDFYVPLFLAGSSATHQ